MRGKLTVLVLVFAVGTISTFATAAPAAAGRATFVSGLQEPTSNPNVFQNSGSLIGTWTTTSFVVRNESYKDVYTLVGTGTETFVGCLDTDRSGACDGNDPAGSIDFTFVFRGTWDLTTGAQLSGGCIHPVVGGTADFGRARGILAYRDDVNTGTASYVGYLSY